MIGYLHDYMVFGSLQPYLSGSIYLLDVHEDLLLFQSLFDDYLGLSLRQLELSSTQIPLYFACRQSLTSQVEDPANFPPTS